MRHKGLLTRILTVTTFVAGLVGLAIVTSPAAGAATPVCTTSTAPAGFKTQVCITTPANRATVSGKVAVTSTVQVTGTAPALNGVQYSIDGAHVLFDFQSPYSVTLHTYLYKFGTHTLGAAAAFSGGYSTPNTSISLTFGIASAPKIAAFKPTAGTNPASGQPFVLAAGGDGATGLTPEKSVVNLISSWNPNLFMYLGDVYQEGLPEEYLNWYGESGSYFDKFRSITDPVIGNHEYTDSPGASSYFDYWGNPPHYYSVNTHGWHIVSLDDTGEYAEGSSTSAQYQWLKNDLAQNTQPCTIVGFHRPIYSLDADEEAGEYFPYWQLMNQYHVTMVLNGHSHNYQRWKPIDANGNVSSSGVTEFVVGTAGNWISPFETTDTRMAAGFDTTATAWGALRLALSSGGASFQFTDIAGQTEDSGTIPCQGAGPDTQAPTAPTALTATAASGREVDLSWKASTDNVGVDSYRILRDGNQVGTVAGYTTSFADTSADAGKTYSYTVVAVDAAGNQSAPSAAAKAITPAATPTFVQGGSAGTSTRVASTTIALNEPVRAGDTLVGWFGQYDSPGQVQVSDNVDGAWTRVQGEPFSHGAGDAALYYTKVTGAAPNGVTVTVSANSATYLDASVADYYGTSAAGTVLTSAVGSGNSVAADSGATASVPAGSVVFAGMLTGGSPGTVTPGKSDGVQLVTRTSISSQSVVGADATKTAAGAQHAVFTLGSATDWYAGALVLRAASTGDSTPPTIPGNLTATAQPNSPVLLSWSASTDDVGVAGYTVYRDGTALGNTGPSTLAWSDATAAPGTTYSYTVSAFDAAGNRSDPSTPAKITTPGAAVQFVQSGIAATGSKVTSATIALPKAVASGDLLVGWFGQYDSPGQVQVSDNVNGAWTRVQGQTFGNGNGDIALYYVKSAAAPGGVTVTMSSTAATYLQGGAADYGGTASPGALAGSSIGHGNSTTADSGTTPAAAGALVVTGLITGGNPGSALPTASAGIVPVVRSATGSGSVTIADVLSATAGAQDGGYTLGAATDWYAMTAVFGP